MREKFIHRLVGVASDPLSVLVPSFGGLDVMGNVSRAAELKAMLEKKNGFYAFGSALHVLSSVDVPQEISLCKWNDQNGWRQLYGARTEGLLFFAEDVFGEQFCFANDRVMRFDPETAEVTFLAATLEDWAELVMREYEEVTGCSLAIAWQKENGPLRRGERLIPKIPFVLGGEFTSANLYAIEATRGMIYRADLYRQLKDLKPGDKVTFQVSA